MKRTLITNIKSLVQVEDTAREAVCGKDMAEVKTIENAYLLIEDDKIANFGTMDTLSENADLTIDAKQRFVLPSFCDSHTHLVYAGSREIEYIDKIRGLSYEEIAKRGGGILNSAKRLQEASEDELFEDAMQRLEEIISYGTGAVEIKSGYGLTTEAELKMLRVIRRLKEASPLTIKANFLGAHGVPLEYRGRQGDFVNLVIDEMIPQVAKENLAEFIDVFCDTGFFTVEETARMLEAGTKHGLVPKIHANELDYSGGIEVGVKYGALSVDHLECVGEKEIATLKTSKTMPTILPGAAFFLNMPYSPARKMIEAGLPVAMASDFNPGSSPSGNMQMVLTFACVNYRLTPQEAINATTINSAYAMGISRTHGSIAKGKQANFYITKDIPTIEYIPYYYGTNKVERTFLNGKQV
ncbi:MAG: imidazolonepropionase [Candidatus Onthomorpha sp.]|nr:imidazolonepropionase [Bacteroidales bacterium]MCI7700726.1 imidazolonepropionase [Bacteroidales bacterium]MDD7591125.1 imidazolonepropionase [Bacteroidales bacterium]MDY5826219.1 imidazolonepropionase [Candidatus Onthomorpha sp.]